jgi:site-specific recombinase XerD
VVRRALDHADVSTTQFYIHQEDGQLEEALERLSQLPSSPVDFPSRR